MASTSANPEDASASEGFDAHWYANTYPDVVALGLQPEYHYRTYGRLLGRRPGPRAAAGSELAAGPELTARPPMLDSGLTQDGNPAPSKVFESVAELPKPRVGHELKAAQALICSHGYEVAIEYAMRHVPQDRAVTLEVLRANEAASRGDIQGWLASLNTYLHSWEAPTVSLGEGGDILSRLTAPHSTPVEGGPKVTVIMPAWNAQHTLGVSATSILAQSWQNLELIIVDDCSSDYTWNVMEQLAARDPRVTLLRNDTNLGPYVSKNLALSHATGDWITGHDADDWAQPLRIQQHMEAALEADADASLAYMLRIRPDGRISKIGSVSDFSPDGVARVASISCLFRKDVLLAKIGFWDCVKYGADSEMIARTRLAVGNRFHTFRSIGMLCLDAETSLTNHPEHGIYANEGRLSSTRANYKACWEKYLAECDPSQVYLAFPQDSRRYTGDFDHIVDVRPR